jgi:hypothetical protein
MTLIDEATSMVACVFDEGLKDAPLVHTVPNPEAAEGFRLDLPDPLSGQAHQLTDHFESCPSLVGDVESAGMGLAKNHPRQVPLAGDPPARAGAVWAILKTVGSGLRRWSLGLKDGEMDDLRPSLNSFGQGLLIEGLRNVGLRLMVFIGKLFRRVFLVVLGKVVLGRESLFEKVFLFGGQVFRVHVRSL